MHARFTIEGHTDSFGSDEYNEKLSLRRAVAVKEWLEKNMDMREADIRAVGYGKSRLIAPSSGSIAEQQINRRVEIVISPN
jgi:outer membrane protein OmpA-like peptidoglycan-associated protein